VGGTKGTGRVGKPKERERQGVRPEKKNRQKNRQKKYQRGGDRQKNNRTKELSASCFQKKIRGGGTANMKGW